MNSIMEDFQNAMANARAANEARYGTIIGGYDQQLQDYVSGGGNIFKGYGQLEKRQQGIGQSMYDDAQVNYLRNLGSAKANLLSRGLGNSTIMGSAERGANQSYGFMQNDIRDKLARELNALGLARLGYNADYQRGLANLQAGKLGFMERRTDAYPDAGIFTALAKAAGAGAAGFPAMGGVTAGGFGSGSRGVTGVPGGSVSTTTEVPGRLMTGPWGTGTRETGGGTQTINIPIGGGAADAAGLLGMLGGAAGGLNGLGMIGGMGGAGGAGGAGGMPFAQDWQAGGFPGWEFMGGGGKQNPWGASDNTQAVWGALGSVPVPQNFNMPAYTPYFPMVQGHQYGNYGYAGTGIGFGGYAGGVGGYNGDFSDY